MRRKIPTIACVVGTVGLMLSASSALGGSVSYNFDTDPASIAGLKIIANTSTGDGTSTGGWVSTGGSPATGGFMALTYGATYMNTHMQFPDLDPGKVVTAFSFEMDLRIGNPSTGDRAADGFSINFARAGDPVLLNWVDNPGRGYAGEQGAWFPGGGGEAAGLPETGVTTGLAISFDTWSGNALPDGADIEGIIVRVDNKTVLRQAMPTRNGTVADATSLQTGPRDTAFWSTGTAATEPAAWATLGWAHLSAVLDDQQKLTIVWKGKTILDKYQTAFFPTPGQLVFAGRTGGSTENTHVDNLQLTTIGVTGTTVPPTIPANLKAPTETLNARRLVLTWDASTAQGGARVAYNIQKDGVQLPLNLTDPTYTDPYLKPNTSYTYKVRAIDVSQNASDWTTISVKTGGEVASPGWINMDIFDNIPTAGTAPAIQDMLDDANFPSKPARGVYLSGLSFGEWTAFGETYGDTYGAQIKGTLTVPTTGSWRFFIRSDDATQLYLNTSGTAIPTVGAVAPICEETDCCDPFVEPGTLNDDTFTSTTSEPVTLTAGTQYGFLVLFKEGTGGDWMQVAMRKEGDTTPAGQLQPIRGAFLSSGTADALGAVAKITQAPQSVTVAANTPVNFSVTADLVSPYITAKQASTPLYQWYKNGSPIYGAWSSNYAIAWASAADTGAKFKVMVAVPGASETSAEATLTVTPDTTPPTILTTACTLNADYTITGIKVQFSEPVSATALNKANYALDKSATISAVTKVDETTVLLTTSPLTASTTYTLTVTGIQDTASPANTIAADTKPQVATWVQTPGFLLFSYWGNLSTTDTALDSGLLADPRYPNSPDWTAYTSAYDSRPIFPDDTHEGYGAKISGWITPTETGDYDFFLRSDDSSRLFLSTDATIGKAVLIAEQTGCCNAFTEPDQGQPYTTAAPIRLVAGQQYYTEALYKEGGGGDYVQVAWRKVGDTTAAANLLPIPSQYLSTLGLPSSDTIDFTTPPANATGVDGKSVTFTAVVTSSSSTLAYQWLRDGVAIPGATALKYTIKTLQLSDSGAKFSIKVTIPGLNKTSPEATLTVVPDTFPPVVSGAGAIKNGNNYEVGVTFDEPVEEASAKLQANYTLSAGTITGLTYYKGSPGVVLTVTGLIAGGQYTLTVKNVADLKGNKITTATKAVTISKMQWGVVGADELALGNGVITVADNGFDIYSDGIGEWGTYDEATFVYEKITGDFDKKLRVEYQDNSSQWARAGLIVRDVTNFGVDNATQTGGAAGKYQKCHVNPVGPTLTGPGTAGNGAWEGNRRLTTGAATTSAGGGGVPQYPNAWCRISRVGQTFTIYRSDDGQNWTSMGATTFTDEPMPAEVFVGPEFSPENGNITNVPDKGMFVAKIRDYGDTAGSVGPVTPTLSVAKTATGMTLTFTGGLQSADSVKGPWTAVTGASPQTVTFTGAQKFFRAVSQ